MRKGWIWVLILVAIILFAVGVIIGIYAFQGEALQDSNMISTQLAEQSQTDDEETNEIVSTSVSEVKLSPSCTIVEKQYFTGCDHLIKNIKEIPDEYINMTEEEIAQIYSDWTLESFSSNQIIVSQEKDGYCEQHYVIREHDGVIGIYTLDESGQETWKEDTEIATKYLTDADLKKLEEGIKAIGDDQLHRTLEDFE